MNSRLALLPILATLACSTVPSRAPEPATLRADAPAEGLTLDEQAMLLRLEDRRELNNELAARWLRNPNPLHRARMALALGRIGSATFDDANGNGVREPGETGGGVALLTTMSADPSDEVRRVVAFALGEIGDPAASDALFTLADDRNASVATSAVEALSKIASGVDLDRYLRYLEPDQPKAVRVRALQYLFRFESPRAREASIALLDDPDDDIRREAAYALARRSDPAARQRLESLLGHHDILIRSHAARALGNIADPASWEPLMRSLDDAHPWMRINSARALSAIAGKHPSAATTDLARDLPQALHASRDPDPGSRAAAIELLKGFAAESAAARERLLELARSGQPWEREIAATSLTSALAKGEPALIRELARSASPWTIAMMLDAAGDSPVGNELRAAYRASSDPLVRSAAIRSIPNSETTANLEVLRAALSDADENVRAAAVGRIAAATLPAGEKWSLVAPLIDREKSEPSNDVRISAIQAAAKLELEGREPMLRSLLGDDDPVVRRIAAELLASELGTPRPQYTPLPVDRPLSDYRAIAEWANSRHTATIETARGPIEVVLLSQEAPMTAWNFARLAEKGYYDGTSFMRVVPNFVIQGGDPRNDMTGGPGYAIRDEINEQRYTRGAVGMALSGPDTGGSQFFITHSPQPHLDGGYTIFGRVIDGMGGVVDQVMRGEPVTSIQIDATSIEGVPDFDDAARLPLPLRVGPTDEETLIASVPEYRSRRDGYRPDMAVLEMIAMSLQPDDRIEVYLGTWCRDSQREVPKLFRVLDELEQNWNVTVPVSYVAVDRTKKEPTSLTAGRNIELVATFIVYRGDRELGRIVETPTSLLEDDLLQILAR